MKTKFIGYWFDETNIDFYWENNDLCQFRKSQITLRMGQRFVLVV